MKKTIVSLLALAFIFTMVQPSFAKDLKIGYVDFFQVYNDYKKTKDYEQILETKKAKEEKKLKGKKDEIEKMKNKLNLLKEEEKNKEREKIVKVMREYEELKWQIFTDLKKERDEKRKEIVEDMDAVIKEYAKKHGFDLILHKNAILYGRNNMEISAEILKIVNSRYK